MVPVVSTVNVGEACPPPPLMRCGYTSTPVFGVTLTNST